MKKIIALILLSFSSFSMAESYNQLNELMNQWLQLESQKGRLQQEWQARNEYLKQKQQLLTLEKNELSSLLKKADENKNQVDEKRLALTNKQQNLENQQAILDEQLVQAIEFIAVVQPRLPPPLQDEWQDKASLLHSETATSSEKLERLLVLLKSADEFNQRVAINQSMMTIEHQGQEKTILVDQIYLGLTHAWYISEDNSHFGYGRSEQLGWKWWHGDNTKAVLNSPLQPEDIANVRKILAQPTLAKYVQLPLALTTTSEEL
ncbi:DUF3450 family protein [Catenovulum sp. SM1970]|uniref:DUF3450 family protein n=1 Tax=Marinifaba aquimaris TaxID=2741323 RepID=UPI0015718575|nr:DUF3450 family protein [Marinifaba aquimaris]NTS76681.1 DUF3450 family protein [Marinifaba aquimaris]